MKRAVWIALSLLLIAFALWGPIVSNVEQARYTVTESFGDIEIREYDALLVAETEVAGARREAIGQGFRIIADYIFGNNIESTRVAMTAPVMQAGSEVAWKIRFVMPASYNMATLPGPNNNRVTLRELPGARFAVIRFSGTAGESNIREHAELLQNFINRQNLTPLSGPLFAFFNPPWTLPFLRRNEIMVEISR